MHNSLRTCLVALSLLVTHVAQAQTDTHEARREAALALIESVEAVMGPKRVAQEWITTMQAPVVRALSNSQAFSEAQKRRALQVLEEELSGVMARMLSEFGPLIHHSVVTLYVQRFTAEEIKELQRLYSNPLLRRAALLNPQGTVTQIMTAGMQKWTPSFTQGIDAALNKLKNEGIDLRAQKASTHSPSAP